MSEEKLNPIEAINEFYRLKDKYESVFYDKYVKPIIKSKKTNKEKRVEYSRLPKHECINCKRNVGTIFNISYDSNELLRNFIAKCGDLTDPCPLDIQINYSVRERFDKLINDGLSSVEELKLDIIKQKNKALFFEKGQNIIKIFEKLTSNLKKETEQLGYYIEKDIIKNENPERVLLLNKSINEFGIGCILPFKQMIQEYLDTDNELIVNQAINFYINEMIPKLNEIQNIRYAVNMVEYDPDEEKYILIQRQNSLENEEESFQNDDKVIKFIKGLRRVNKTKKNDVIKTNKTRKLKPTLEIVGDEEELGLEQEEKQVGGEQGGGEQGGQGEQEQKEFSLEQGEKEQKEFSLEQGEKEQEELGLVGENVTFQLKFEGNNSDELNDNYYDSEDDNI
jgi:hypothetical protein